MDGILQPTALSRAGGGTAVRQDIPSTEWGQQFSNEAAKVQFPGMPQSKLDLEALKNMSPSEMENALVVNGDQMRQEFQKNIAQMSPEAQQKAIQEWAQSYKQMMNSPSGKVFASAMQLPLPTGNAVAGGVAPLAFLDLLRPKECLVDVYKYRIRAGNGFGPEHYLLAVSQSMASHRFVELGPAEPIDSTIESFFRELRLGGDLARPWKALQELVARPILAAPPNGTTKLWLSPDSSLALVPFASLMLDMRVPLSVSIVPSAYDFARLRATSSVQESGSALLVGNIDYGPSGRYKQLEDTEEELDDVRSTMTSAGIQIVTLQGTQATRTRVLGPIRGARFLHFATHGNWSEPSSGSAADSFKSAKVALSMANTQSPESVLTAEDITHVNLSGVQLLTLSACESAEGRPVDGQGLLGFQTAFMAAGAKSVLLALWRVPDKATSELMQAFYDGLLKRGLSEADALRQAQDVVRAKPESSDPASWAAWVLVGKGW
jgi:CHAT domain-containing protein